MLLRFRAVGVAGWTAGRTLATAAASATASPKASSALPSSPATAAAAAPKMAAGSALTSMAFPPHFDAQLSALAARIHVEAKDLAILRQAVVHKSFHHGNVPHNERLVYIGHLWLRTVVAEHLYNMYPKMPASALLTAVDMYIGDASSVQIAENIGLDLVTLWSAPEQKEEAKAAKDAEAKSKPSNRVSKGNEKVISSALRGLVGAIYHTHGTVGVKRFVNDYVLSRTIDTGAALNFEDPKRLLSALLKRMGREPAESRIMKETGRKSHAAMFLVGVYSGNQLLASGAGQSIKIAETVAAKNALQTHFLEQIKMPLSLLAESQAAAPPADTPPII